MLGLRYGLGSEPEATRIWLEVFRTWPIREHKVKTTEKKHPPNSFWSTSLCCESMARTPASEVSTSTVNWWAGSG